MRNVIFAFVLVILLLYLVIPPPQFPAQMPESFKSNEPADIETPLRQGFYTDWERAQIMDYFKRQFSLSSLLAIPLPTLELNYPPEEAQTIIRDQTQSRYLEEFAHPLRESLYVNGFFAQKASERMFANGREYKTKVIIRYVPSNPVVRLIVAYAAVVLGFKVVVDFLTVVRKIRNG